MISLRDSAERLMAMIDTPDRRSDAEDLVAQIADALAVASEYVARIDLEHAQRVVDLSWAARQAGRRLGIRIDVTSRVIKADSQMQVCVTALSPLP